MEEVIPYEQIEGRIYLIRGKKVMFDCDLARLYGVETKVLNQAVKRNIERFPDDFMFILSEVEAKNLRSQFVTSSLENYGGVRYLPTAFTEQGVAMLSGVLKSPRAIAVNIQIFRTFTKLREMIQENDYLRRKLEVLEKDYDEKFAIVFDAIRRLLNTEDEPISEIGFKN
ncbi:MAG: ORF6N domain-containing protein [Candidatus Uhrbacteria bacterium]